VGFFILSSNKAWGAIKSTLKENSVVREMMGAKGLSNRLAAGVRGLSTPGPLRTGMIGAGVGAGAGALRAGSNNDGPMGYAGNIAAGAALGAAGGALFGGKLPPGAGAKIGDAARGVRERVATGAFVHAGQMPASLDDARIFTRNFMKSVRDGWRA
jgi:hypothetical protein